MQKIDIEETLTHILKEEFDIDTPCHNDKLKYNLGLQSLEHVEFVMAMEKHFDIRIPDNDLSNISSDWGELTINDLTPYIQKKVNGHATS